MTSPIGLPPRFQSKLSQPQLAPKFGANSVDPTQTPLPPDSEDEFQSSATSTTSQEARHNQGIQALMMLAAIAAHQKKETENKNLQDLAAKTPLPASSDDEEAELSDKNPANVSLPEQSEEEIKKLSKTPAPSLSPQNEAVLQEFYKVLSQHSTSVGNVYAQYGKKEEAANFIEDFNASLEAKFPNYQGPKAQLTEPANPISLCALSSTERTKVEKDIQKQRTQILKDLTSDLHKVLKKTEQTPEGELLKSNLTREFKKNLASVKNNLFYLSHLIDAPNVDSSTPEENIINQQSQANETKAEKVAEPEVVQGASNNQQGQTVQNNDNDKKTDDKKDSILHGWKKTKAGLGAALLAGGIALKMTLIGIVPGLIMAGAGAALVGWAGINWLSGGKKDDKQADGEKGQKPETLSTETK